MDDKFNGEINPQDMSDRQLQDIVARQHRAPAPLTTEQNKFEIELADRRLRRNGEQIEQERQHQPVRFAIIDRLRIGSATVADLMNNVDDNSDVVNDALEQLQADGFIAFSEASNAQQQVYRLEPQSDYAAAKLGEISLFSPRPKMNEPPSTAVAIQYLYSALQAAVTYGQTPGQATEAVSRINVVIREARKRNAIDLEQVAAKELEQFA